MCAHNSIRVKVCLKRRCVFHENICLICQGGSETILHALRNCPQIKHVWNQLKIMSSNQAFWRNNLHEWLSSNGRESCRLIAPKPHGKLSSRLLCETFGKVEIDLFLVGKART